MVYENTYHENDVPVISKIFSGSLALLRNFAVNGQLKFVMLLCRTKIIMPMEENISIFFKCPFLYDN